MSGGFVRLSVVLVLGAIVGIWTFIEPWMIQYPLGTGDQWTPSTWSNVWVGAIVTGASVVGLVVTVATGLWSAVRAEPATQVEQESHSSKV
jgi:hypothetical protein